MGIKFKRQTEQSTIKPQAVEFFRITEGRMKFYLNLMLEIT